MSKFAEHILDHNNPFGLMDQTMSSVSKMRKVEHTESIEKCHTYKAAKICIQFHDKFTINLDPNLTP